jgi:hypothetical protein
MTTKKKNRQSIHRGPPPGIVAVVFVLLSAASILVTLLMAGGMPYPTFYSQAVQTHIYYTKFATVLRITAFLRFGSMFPLGVFTTTFVSLLYFHKIKVAGVQIAYFGGITSSLFLGISSLIAWILSQPSIVENAGALYFFQFFAFATCNVGHTATLGLLLAGVSVPCLLIRLIPRWISWVGLIIAAICVFSTLSMVLPALSILRSVGRFSAYIWLIAAGFSIPKEKSKNNIKH